MCRVHTKRVVEIVYLACTTTSDDALVFDGSFDNHDSIVQTPLNFRNELFSSSSQHKRTRLSGRAVFKEIEPLSAYLSLLETPASTQMLFLDVGACG